MIETETINIDEFKFHPIYFNYLANKKGIIINIKIKKPMKGSITRNYKTFGINFKNKFKHLLWHRFVWECFNDIIPDKMQVDHINNNKLE